MGAEGRRRESAGTAWLAGLVLGAAGVVLLFEAPSIGLPFGAALLLLLIRSGRGVIGIGGVLLGSGLLWAGLLLNAAARCAAFNSLPGSSCEMSDQTGLILGGLVAVAIGLGLTVLGARGQPSDPRDQ